jgi:hypothetical protein
MGHKHSRETRSPERLGKLAHPIGLWKRLTIGATLSFVNQKRPDTTPCRSCGTLRSFDLVFKDPDQKIAACRSSYIDTASWRIGEDGG